MSCDPSQIVYWFLIRFCRLSKQEKLQELARRQDSAHLSEADPGWEEEWDTPDTGKVAPPGHQSHHSYRIDAPQQEDWSVGFQPLGDREQGGGLLSRAGSMCSVKIRQQFTVLRMFFGRLPTSE